MLLRLWAIPVLALSLSGLWAQERPGVWLDVPFVAQVRNGCGAASAAMLVRYWRGESTGADPREIMKQLYSSPAEGIYASQLKEYLEKQGFLTYTFRGEWADLVHHLSKGRPLLVCLSESKPDLHYVVVSGIDWQSQIVFLNDPARKKLFPMERDKFLQAWEASNRWTLLALPKDPAS